MDYRAKVVNVPSIEDAVKKGQRVKVNGIMFGYSDKFGAIVSEPVSLKEVEPFRRVPGYAVIDATTGDLVSAPEPVQVSGGEAPKEQRDADQIWLEQFLAKFKEGSDSAKARIPNDELKKALRLLKVNHAPDAKKEELIALLDDAVAQAE